MNTSLSNTTRCAAERLFSHALRLGLAIALGLCATQAVQARIEPAASSAFIDRGCVGAEPRAAAPRCSGSKQGALPAPILVAPHACGSGGCMIIGRSSPRVPSKKAALPAPILVAPHPCGATCIRVAEPAPVYFAPLPAPAALPAPILVAPHPCPASCFGVVEPAPVDTSLQAVMDEVLGAPRLQAGVAPTTRQTEA